MLQSPIKKLRTTIYQERIDELKAQTSRTQAEEKEIENWYNLITNLAF